MSKTLFGRRRDIFFLLAVLILCISAFLLVFSTRTRIKTSYYDIQLDAAMRMQKCIVFLRDYVAEAGIEIEEEDINGTGLIGPAYSELLTSLGHLESKRSTLNPNMAALMVRLLHDAGLKKGSTVAIGSSGSFPAMAIATICACNAMGLQDKTILSYGASNYGATRVELNIQRILDLLKKEGLISLNLLAVSPGSDNDYGVGTMEGILFDNTRDVVVGLGLSSGVEFIDLGNLAASIKRRMEIYGDIDAFVSIGGPSVNIGTSMEFLDVPPGLSMSLKSIPEGDTRGLVFEYAQRGVPVINILNIRGLCADYGLPVDPMPLPGPGDGGVYYETAYNTLLTVVSLVIILAVLGAGIVLSRRIRRTKP